MDRDILLIIISIVVSAIISITITIFFTGRKRLMFIMKTTSFSLKKFEIPQLSITFKETNLETLSVTNLTIINSGNRLIEGNDIAPNDRLNISVPKPFSFFHFKISNNKANNVEITQITTSKYLISFEYMDKGDKVLIDLFHNAEKVEPTISGKIKATRMIQSNIRHPYLKSITNTIASIFVTFLSVVVFLNMPEFTEKKATYITLIIFFIIVTCGGMFIFIKEMIDIYKTNKRLNNK